jgi:hypothetical protein
MLEKLLDKWQQLSKAGKIVVVIAVLGALNLVFAPEPKKQEPPQQATTQAVKIDEKAKAELKSQVASIVPDASTIDISTGRDGVFDVNINITKDYDSIESAKQAGRDNIQKIIDAKIPANIESISIAMVKKTATGNPPPCMVMYVPAKYATNDKDSFSFTMDGKSEEMK